MTSSDPAGKSDATAKPADKGLIVYFDGSCPLCTAEINYYASRGGGEALHLVDVSSTAADTGPDLDRHDALRRFHVRRPDGSLLSGAAAFSAIWKALPGWRHAGRLAGFRPVTLLLEGGYRLLLPIRPALSRLAQRMLRRR
jgi:predicted DCC family thiol-disulfide oxidoreductase YuxK